jgi:diguanylate cyclase (GGDEF)-like protein/PAS domain S-box-containing protein
MSLWMPRSLREAVAPAATTLAVAAAVSISVALTRVPSGVASLWIANGILVGVLLRTPSPHWPLLFGLGALAQVLPRLALGDAPLVAFGLTAINLAEVALVAVTIRRRVPDIDAPEAMLRVSRLATVTTVLACTLSATAAAALWSAYGSPFGEIWLTWFCAHLLGMVIVATLAVVALGDGLFLLGRQGRRADFAACMLLLVFACAVVFAQQRYPLLFLVHLPLLLLTYRHGMGGAVLGLVAVGVASTAAALLQFGPFRLVASASIVERNLLAQVFVGATALMALPVALALTARRRLAAQVRESESRYRLLADHAQDIVVRVGDGGQPSYVSPSVQNLLGWTPAEFGDHLVHPDDRARRDAVFARLLAQGGDAKVVYRVRHRDGRDVSLEALATRVSGDGRGGHELVYSARDVTARVAAEAAVVRNRQRLQSLIDGIPAMVAHIDTDERYTFANRAIGRALRRDPHAIVGRTLREVRGEAAYRLISPHVQAALRGEPQTFEGVEHPREGVQLEYQASYVPEFDAQGRVCGFYSLTTDISALKRAERELAQLAREDPLTGLANRRQFDERLEQAVVRSRRLELPLALMLVDVDYFKQVNDRHGHPAGDAVLRAFADRIRASTYDVDLVARLGGDEFAVLFEYATGIQQVAVVARKILDAMRVPVELDGGSAVDVAASIGIGFQREASYGLSLMALADKALYAAKQAGRGTYRQLHD